MGKNRVYGVCVYMCVCAVCVCVCVCVCVRRSPSPTCTHCQKRPRVSKETQSVKSVLHQRSLSCAGHELAHNALSPANLFLPPLPQPVIFRI